MKILQRLIIFGVFAAIFVAIVAYARGYRLDFRRQGAPLTSTGIISVSSSPNAAKIFINGELKGVTDTSLTMPPGKYTVEVQKDGYMAWKRTITLKGELVMAADALLFPLNPSLTPLTNLGVGKIVPIDQTGRILLFSDNGNAEKDGIYVFDQSKKPFSLFPPLKLLVLKKDLPATVNLLNSRVTFSPDFKEGVFEFLDTDGKTIVAYDMGFDEQVQSPFEVTASMASLTKAWDDERAQEAIKILETLPRDMRPIASDSFHIISFAPDKTKFLYEVTKPVALPVVITPPLISADQEPQERSLVPGQLYIYDIKEDTNFRLNVADADFEKKGGQGEWRMAIDNYIMWYPDSRHILLNELTQVSVMEYDNTNKQVIYSGPHEMNFLDITTDGKLLILANLNPQQNKSPDVYAVGLR